MNPIAIVAVVLALGVGYLLGNEGISMGSSSAAVEGHNIKESAYMGKKKAPVTIVEYSDFECPFCARGAQTMDQIKEQYVDDGKVKIVFKHFPLAFHKNAQKAGEAAECAGDQGKFWEMHDKMFENQKSLMVDNLKQYAADLGLKADKFNTCLDEGKYAQKVMDDMADGKRNGVSGTPAFFVNDVMVSGAQPIENFKKIIDAYLSGDEEAIAQAKMPPTPQAPPAPNNDPVEIDGGGNEVMGDANAPIEIIKFSEYECPFCTRAHNNIMPSLKKDYIETGKVKFVHRDFPLAFHPNAQKMAEASECAGDQGKYWEMHDTIFANPSMKSVDDMKAHAKTIGLDEAAFASCLDDGTHAQEVKDDMAAGQEVGVRGTPTFFVNGVPVRGAVPYENLKQVIEAELAK